MAKFVSYKICIHGNPKVGEMEVFAVEAAAVNYENLKKEIFDRKPELKDRDIRIYYTDAEHDCISIANEADFVIFKESGASRIYVAVNHDEEVRQPEKKSKKATGGLVRAPLIKLSGDANHTGRPITPTPMPSTPSMPLTKKVSHPYVYCDACDKNIVGYRYKCLDCYDFDLCMSCESKMVHPNHVIVRVATPTLYASSSIKDFRNYIESHRDVDWKEGGQQRQRLLDQIEAKLIAVENRMQNDFDDLFEALEGLRSGSRYGYGRYDDTRYGYGRYDDSRYGYDRNYDDLYVVADRYYDKYPISSAYSTRQNLGQYAYVYPMPAAYTHRAPYAEPIKTSKPNVAFPAGETSARTTDEAAYSDMRKTNDDRLANLLVGLTASLKEGLNKLDANTKRHSDDSERAKPEFVSVASATKRGEKPAPAVPSVPVAPAAKKYSEATPVAPAAKKDEPTATHIEAAAEVKRLPVAKPKEVKPLSEDDVEVIELDKSFLASDYSSDQDDVTDANVTTAHVVHKPRDAVTAGKNEEKLMRDLHTTMTSLRTKLHSLEQRSGEKSSPAKHAVKVLTPRKYEDTGKSIEGDKWTFLNANSTGARPRRTEHLFQPLNVSNVTERRRLEPTRVSNDVKQAHGISPREAETKFGWASPANHESVINDQKIEKALGAMIEMGFNNEGGWLKQLLQSVNGDIQLAMDKLQPRK